MTDIFAILAGNLVRFTMVFRNVAGDIADPTEVSCRVGLGSGTPETLDVERDDVGTYHADWDTTGRISGDYFCRADGTGDVLAVREIKVRIRMPHIAG